LLIQDYTRWKDFLKEIALNPFILFLKNFAFLLFRRNVRLLRKDVLRNAKTRNVLSLIYLEIYHVVEGHAWDKESKILETNWIKFHQKN